MEAFRLYLSCDAASKGKLLGKIETLLPGRKAVGLEAAEFLMNWPFLNVNCNPVPQSENLQIPESYENCPDPLSAYSVRLRGNPAVLRTAGILGRMIFNISVNS